MSFRLLLGSSPVSLTALSLSQPETKHEEIRLAMDSRGAMEKICKMRSTLLTEIEVPDYNVKCRRFVAFDNSSRVSSLVLTFLDRGLEENVRKEADHIVRLLVCQSCMTSTWLSVEADWRKLDSHQNTCKESPYRM
jgi:hypothetical protein